VASVAADYEPPGFRRERVRALEALEEGHFWFAPRARLVSRILAKHVPSRIEAALELGCGSGTMLPLLGEMAGEVAGVDAHSALLERAAERAPGARLIQSDVTRTPLGPAQFDLLISLDVLEHVDPVVFLSEARRLAKPGALFFVSVPAFQFLWSEADRIAGHRCRYSLGQLRAELAENGWECIGHNFYQALLFPLMVLTRRIAPRRLRGAERRPSRLVSTLLGAVNSAEVEISSRLAMPFGSSLFAWARSS